MGGARPALAANPGEEWCGAELPEPHQRALARVCDRLSATGQPRLARIMATILTTLLGDPAVAIAAASRLAVLLEDPVLSTEGLEAVDALLSALTDARQPLVRAACADALENLYWRADDPFGAPNLPVGERVALGLCEALPREPAPESRIAIVKSMQRHGFALADRIFPLLRHTAASDPIAEVREEAQAALDLLEDFDAI
jgi:hypothetical protein